MQFNKYALTDENQISGPHVGSIVSLHDRHRAYPYGFLTCRQTAFDVYFAFSDIESGTARRIRPGQAVEFMLHRISPDPRRGLRAKVKYATKDDCSPNKETEELWTRKRYTQRRYRNLGRRRPLIKNPTSRVARGPDESGTGFNFKRTMHTEMGRRDS